MDDLTKAAQENDTNKIAPALNEYKASISAVAKNLSNEKDAKKVRELVVQVKQLESKENQIKSLGVELGDNPEKDSVLIQLIQKQITELETKDLPSGSEELLESIKTDCANQKFIDALEKILIINANSTEKAIPEVSPEASPLI